MHPQSILTSKDALVGCRMLPSRGVHEPVHLHPQREILSILVHHVIRDGCHGAASHEEVFRRQDESQDGGIAEREFAAGPTGAMTLPRQQLPVAIAVSTRVKA